MKIVIKPLGEVELEILENLRIEISNIFGSVVELASKIDIPLNSFNKERCQYLASSLLSEIKKYSLNRREKILGITDTDLYVPDLNFVFGLSEINGNAAVVSIVRLRQDADKDKFFIRTVKEAVHELGHAFGLSHCDNNKCVMHFSNTLHDTDLKQHTFCINCRPRLVK